MAAPASFGPEFRVNTTTLGNQDSSSIAALANGQFVAAWEDGGASGINAIRAQIYNADGSKFRGELTMFAGSTDQVRPVVTGMADGRFALAWEDHSGAAPNILARVFNSDGTSPSGAYQDAFLAAPGDPGAFQQLPNQPCDRRSRQRTLPGQLDTARRRRRHIRPRLQRGLRVLSRRHHRGRRL